MSIKQNGGIFGRNPTFNDVTIEGQLTFDGGYVLSVWELLDLNARTIRSYSYELDRAGERVWWYDPTGHPEDASLAATHPHHKHVPPDIKHHRVPAPEISFTRPNLPFLIGEIEHLLKYDRVV